MHIFKNTLLSIYNINVSPNYHPPPSDSNATIYDEQDLDLVADPCFDITPTNTGFYLLISLLIVLKLKFK